MKTKTIWKHIEIAIGILTILVSIDGIAHAMVVDEVKGQAAEQGPIMEQEVYVAEGKTGMVMKKTQGDKKAPQYAPGEIIIKLKEKVSEDTLYGQRYSTRIAGNTSILSDLKTKYNLKDPRPVSKALHEQLKSKNISMRQLRGAKAKPGKDLFPVYIVKTSEDPLAISNRLKNDPNIEYAEPNYKVEVQMVPNDPYYSSSGSWGQPYDDLWGIKKIQCEQAWDISQGDGVVVAVIDTGVDYNHPDLWDNIWVNPAVISDRNSDGKIDLNDCDLNSDHFIEQNEIVDNMFGWDFDNNDNNPMDGYGHGTHCAGTVAAVGNNSIGVIGVAPRAKIMILKGLGDDGKGYIEKLVQCVTYAADHGARITSNSWGGKANSQTLIDAFTDAYQQGCVSIAAAANSNMDVAYFTPANIDKVIAVAASNHKNQRCSFSNYGSKIDIAAPGGGIENEMGGGRDDLYNILSTMPDACALAIQRPQLKVSNGYWRLAGTSMACPHIAGLAALIVSRHPEYTFENVRAIMKSATTDNITSDEFIGKGIANALSALSMASPPDGDARIISPSYGDIGKNRILPVLGSATGSAYTVSYSAAGPYSNSWTEIGGGGNVQNGTLVSFNASNLGTGNYFVKLRVTDTHGYEMINTAKIYVDTTLLPGWPQKISDAMIISSPVCADFKGDGNKEIFAVDFFGNACMWDAAGNVMPGWPQEVSTSGAHVFATPAAADLDGDSTLEIIVAVSLYDSKLLIWRYDGTVYAQTPISYNGAQYMVIEASPVVGDMNADGFPEIGIAALNAYDQNMVPAQNVAKIFAFDAHGVLLPGWPYEMQAQHTMYLGGTPALADLDNDGGKEMAIAYSDEDLPPVTGYTYLTVLNGQGVVLPGWPKVLTNAWTPNSVSIGDFNNDGKPWIFFATTQTKIYGFDSQLNAFPGSPCLMPCSSLAGPVVLSDLDNDDLLEFVVQDMGAKVAVRYFTGQNNWPVDLANTVFFGLPFVSSPVIGDIDGDGNSEVVVASEGSSELYAFRRSGVLMDLFPKKVGDDGSAHIVSTPSIVDLNNDGKADIIVGGVDGRVYAWGMGSSTDVTKMEWPMFQHDLSHTGCYHRLEPLNWHPYAPTSGNRAKYTRAVSNSGIRSLKIYNSTVDYTYWYGDAINFNSPYPKTFALSGWAKGQNITSSSWVPMYYLVTFEDNTSNTYYIADLMFPIGSYAWKKRALTYTFNKGVKSITPYLQLYGKGAVWFDDISISIPGGANLVPNPGMKAAN